MQCPKNINQQIHQQNSCQKCKVEYQASSEEEQSQSAEQQNEQIVFPMRKNRQKSGKEQNRYFQAAIKNLQMEVHHLKQSNIEKDILIDDLRKEIQHKMSHFVMKGKISKQQDEINRLRNQINYGPSNFGKTMKNSMGEQEIRSIVREESKKMEEMWRNRKMEKQYSDGYLQRKYRSTYDNYGKLKEELLKKQSKEKMMEKPQRISSNFKANFNYSPRGTMQYSGNTMGNIEIFNMKDAKHKIYQLEQKIKIYQSEINWLSNFALMYVKTAQNIAYKSHNLQIVSNRWSLKKKVKACWRYMKHFFTVMAQKA